MIAIVGAVLVLLGMALTVRGVLEVWSTVVAARRLDVVCTDVVTSRFYEHHCVDRVWIAAAQQPKHWFLSTTATSITDRDGQDRLNETMGLIIGSS